MVGQALPSSRPSRRLSQPQQATPNRGTSSPPFTQGHAQSLITTGALVVNLDSKAVTVHGSRINLTSKEYQILELLALRKGSTLTKEVFLNNLYGGLDEPDAKIIDVFICKLRKKLAAASQGYNFIETVWGRGYALREPTEQSIAS